MAVDWITLSPESGEAGTEKISITRKEHTGTQARTATITFSNTQSKSQEVIVVQKAVQPFITGVNIDSSFVVVNGSGETKHFILSGNTSHFNMTITNPDGLTFQAKINNLDYPSWEGMNSESDWKVPDSPGKAAAYSIDVAVTFPSNETELSKTYELTIKAGELQKSLQVSEVPFTYPDEDTKITILQPSKTAPYLEVSKTSFNVEASTGEDNITIATSSSWDNSKA